jgi:CRP-like cAMP-binding protein
MILDASALFAGTSAEFREKIAAMLEEESLPEGHMLFRRGDPARFFYLLIEGRVRLVIGERGQTSNIVSRPGEFLGWSTLVERDSFFSSAQCLTSTRIAKIAGEGLQAILRAHPEDGMRVFKQLAGFLGRRLIQAHTMLPASHGPREAPSYG